MVTDVHRAFGDILKGTSWMDAKTTKAGVEKLDSMLQLVGYGNKTLNATDLDDHYKEVNRIKF